MFPLFTIGHSRHALEDFLPLLAGHSIDILADVRAAPYSRRHPQFNRETLQESLAAGRIRYRWLGEALCGLSEGGNEGAHPALREPAFRAYADHMASDAFVQTLDRLCEGAARWRIALMCAEADAAHCHRQFIADALVLRGLDVHHIEADASLRPHVCHPALRVVDGAPRYDGQSQPALFDP